MTWTPEPSGWRPPLSYEAQRSFDRLNEAMAQLAAMNGEVASAARRCARAAEAFGLAIDGLGDVQIPEGKDG